MPKPQVTFVQGNSEWSALYVDGKLDVVGDHYLSEDRIREIFDVQVIYSDEFLQGGDARGNCLPTLDEVWRAIEAKEDRMKEAQSLREQADALREEADRLDGKTK